MCNFVDRHVYLRDTGLSYGLKIVNGVKYESVLLYFYGDRRPK